MLYHDRITVFIGSLNELQKQTAFKININKNYIKIRKPNFIRRAIPESNSEQISTNTNNTSNTPRKQPPNAVT
jgi:hypothetical protein